MIVGTFNLGIKTRSTCLVNAGGDPLSWGNWILSSERVILKETTRTTSYVANKLNMVSV